jgi:3',5'-cyclic AMP phosphodiesterase CpdA
MRLIQLSDTHVSARHRMFEPNIEATAAWLRANAPELIVHTGDMAMDGAGDAADLDAAAAWHARLGAPVRAVPGNHDVGDVAAIKPEQVVNDERLAAWRNRMGPDFWAEDRGGWRLVGLDAMLLGTGHAAEERQFAWLAEVLATHAPVAVFLHKPLFIDHPDEGPRGYWTVTPGPRRRLLDLLAGARVRLIASGHLHIHRDVVIDGVRHVWGPSSAFVCGESQEPELGGSRMLGVVEHIFEGAEVTSRFIRPGDLADHLIEPHLDTLYPRPKVSA